MTAKVRRWRVRWKSPNATVSVFRDYLSHADALRYAVQLARRRPELTVKLQRAW